MMDLVVVPIDNIWLYRHREARNIAQSKLWGTHIAYNIQIVLICWLSFSSEWEMTLLAHDKDLTLSRLITLLGGNCE